MSSKPYQPDLVGSFIAVGGEHLVFRYGDDKVIKFPFGPRYLLGPFQYCRNINLYLKMLNKYFLDFLPKKEILFYKKFNFFPYYVVIENFIDGRHLTVSDLLDRNVRKEFLKILKQNDLMFEKDGYSIDFFGIWNLIGLRKKVFSNLVLESKTNKIFVLDTGIWRVEHKKDCNIMVHFFIKWAYARQKNMLSSILSYLDEYNDYF